MSAALTDFPDRLSPMVVKELRQGLRLKLFGGVYLTLHIVLVLVTLMGGASSNAGGVTELFDWLVTVLLCVVLPLRGFSALAQEMRSGTLDMLVLTRLSAWRIVTGKWASTALLSLLLAVSVAPYVVARYVFGGVDLPAEIGVLLLKWLAGAVISAAIVCVSTLPQLWLRGVLIGLPLLAITFFGTVIGLTSAIFRSVGGGGMWATFSVTDHSFVAWLGIVAFAAWVVFTMLGVATTRISPLSSLFPVFKRLVHAVAVSIGTAVSPVFGMVMLHLAMVDVLLEENSDVPSVYAVFEQRGWMGRLAAWFLAPGWSAGFLFSVLLASAITGLTWWTAGWDAASGPWLAACTLWFVGFLMQLISGGRSTDRAALFVCVFLCVQALVIFISSMMAATAVSGRVPWVGVAIPALVPSAHAMCPAAEKARFLEVGLASACVWPLLHLLQVGWARRRLRPVFAEAREIARSARQPQ